MTFTEAAAQVLRLVGKPLHYKEITDVAIEKNLLSHVGKSPDVTMGARLAALVKKNEKDNPLVRVKPGVFALREWDQKFIDQGLADRTPALERLAQNPDLPLEPEPESEPVPGVDLGADAPADDAERVRAQLAAEATALFAPEEDDDEPIFGADGEEPASDGADGEAGRRRRKRRRRGKGVPEDAARGDLDDLPQYTVSDAPTEAVEGTPEPTRTRGERREERADRDRGDRDRGDRDRGDRGDRDRGDRPAIDLSGRTPDELGALDVADAVASALATFDRSAGPVPLGRLAEVVVRRSRVSGDPAHLQAVVGAAVRADNLRRSAAGQRTRFRISGQRVALTDWSLDHDLLRLERELHALGERFREHSRRLLLRRIQELPHRAIGDLALLLLERLGVTDLVPVRRPGQGGGELSFAGRQRTATGEQRVAVLVRRDGREVGRERVAELRGALHHYGPAHAGIVITTGQVLSGAREEAASAGAAPVTLIDGLGLARHCEEQGVGVVKLAFQVAFPDLDAFEALRGGGG